LNRLRPLLKAGKGESDFKKHAAGSCQPHTEMKDDFPLRFRVDHVPRIVGAGRRASGFLSAFAMAQATQVKRNQKEQIHCERFR
jgi:hypothetical protein